MYFPRVGEYVVCRNQIGYAISGMDVGVLIKMCLSKKETWCGREDLDKYRGRPPKDRLDEIQLIKANKLELL